MTAIWDEAFLKQRERDARADALAVQSDADWESAVMQFERETSDVSEGFVDCLLSGCRRALRCVGNPPICMPRCRREFEPGVAQEQVEEIYAEIQEERRDAAAQGRAPEVERALDYVQEDDEAIDEIDEPPPPPRDEPGRDMRIVREALQRDDAPSQPPPQPQLPKPEPAAAPPPDHARPAAPAVPVAPPPPDPWEPTISPEVEERINRIWADYVAGKPMPRPVPRIRSL
jgi:pyruvate/2-oxoglutarate dehydrogenase complex dihydrolipoamide acyltransferase (E2) component